MTVTIVKKESVVKKGTTPVKSDLSIKVDRLIELKAIIDPLKVSVDEYDKLRKELASLADTISSPNEPAVFEGDNGSLTFSACGSERKIINMKKLFSLMDEDTFFKLAKLSLSDLDKYVLKAEQSDVVATSLTGARKISISPKQNIVAA